MQRAVARFGETGQELLLRIFVCHFVLPVEKTEQEFFGAAADMRSDRHEGSFASNGITAQQLCIRLFGNEINEFYCRQ